jgi:putative transposase
MTHRRPPRLRAELYRGPQRIFITMCTFERRASFETALHVNSVCEELLRTAGDYDVDVVAYCFMPDHLHALLKGHSNASDVAKCVAMFRQRSGHRYRRQFGSRIWQEGYYDRVLREEDDTLEIARYIAANPVRAGLCQDACEYPYLGSSCYSLDVLVRSLA